MSDPFVDIIGQDRAVAQLRAAVERPVHAYLFVGPAGSGKRQAALAFAAALLNDDRAAVGVHPDVVIVEREGASISVGQAREITRLAARSPINGSRKVLILNDFHLVGDAAPALLKTIEEASASTIFVILAESVPSDLVTVASRCVRIDFCALPVETVESILLLDGVAPERAAQAALSSSGNLDRARLLATDESASGRSELWTAIPGRLDGTGFVVMAVVDDILAAVEGAVKPLVARHDQERVEFDERVKATGQVATLLKALETRHKREQRRFRVDELRAGLAILAIGFGQRIEQDQDSTTARSAIRVLRELTEANEALNFNPNEALLLQRLLVRLSHLSTLAVRAG